MINVEIFVSCGSEVDELRDVANRVVTHIDNMVRNVMRLGVKVSIAWDFRIDPPTVVPEGEKFSRSLSMVEGANALVAILGEAVPEGTRLEILHAFELRRGETPFEVFMFLDPERKREAHDDLLHEIEEEFHETVMYAPYESDLEFQAILFSTVVPFVLAATSIFVPTPFGGPQG